jgi:hypothetical protein
MAEFRESLILTVTKFLMITFDLQGLVDAKRDKKTPSKPNGARCPMAAEGLVSGVV